MENGTAYDLDGGVCLLDFIGRIMLRLSGFRQMEKRCFKGLIFYN